MRSSTSPSSRFIRLRYAIATACLQTVARRATVLGGLALASAPCWVLAAPASYEVDLPASTLKLALSQLSAQTKTPIRLLAVEASNQPVSAVKGNFDLAGAIRALLGNSTLEVSIAEDGSYLVGSPPAGGRSSRAIPTVVVFGKRQQIDTRTQLTRSGTDITETAQAATVISQDQLEQQQSTSVADALNGVQGIQVQSSNASTAITMRGFNATVLVDGMSAGDSSSYGVSSGGLSRPIAAIDRIEVLAGADAISAGAGAGQAFGGVVNVAIKRPQAEPVRQIGLELGSNDHHQLSLDLAGAATEDKTWLYRLVAATTEDDKSPAGFDLGKRDRYILASAGFDQPATSLNAGVEYQKSKSTRDRSLVIKRDGGTVKFSPAGNPEDRFSTDRSSAFLELRQNLSADWVLQAKFKHSSTDADNRYYTISPDGYVQDDVNTFTFAGTSARYHFQVNAADVSVRHEMDFSEGSNTLVFGANQQLTDFNSGTVANYNVGDSAFDFPALSAYSGDMSNGYARDTNVFVQDNLKFRSLTANFSLTNSAEKAGSHTSNNQYPNQSATSPALGLLYSMTGEWSAYANYRKSFYPQSSALLADDSIAPPLRALSQELGVKFARNASRLVANASVYKVTNQNQLQQLSGGDRFEVIGRSSSHGANLSLTGDLLAHLHSTLSYTYTKAFQSNVQVKDITPKHTFRSYTSYDLSGDETRGLSVGLGAQIKSSYNIQLDTYDFDATNGVPVTSYGTYRVPGQVIWDTNANYHVPWGRISFGIRNLFNSTAYGAGDQTNLPIIPGRTFLLSAKIDF